jgi:peptidoglycan lytic transglycosylase B
MMDRWTWLRLGCGAIAIVTVIAMSPPAGAVDYDRGWGYLIAKLERDGVDRAVAGQVFRDRRVPPFTGLGFSLDPREPQSRYRALRSAKAVAAARACRRAHDRELREAEKRLGVPASVVSAILHVETSCGRFTGKNIVLHRLARLAMANEPDNVEQNIIRHTAGLPAARVPSVTAKVRERARALEATFYPEVVATFRLAEQLRVDPLALRGSPSGAFGMPQFLPSSYLRFALDGDGDGRVSLYDPADAIASAANYLAGYGWRPDSTRAEQRRVIWQYNHSDAYIDTILFLAERIESAHPSTLSLARK